MSGRIKRLRGHIEEVVAEVTGDAALQEEGRARMGGRVSSEAASSPGMVVCDSSDPDPNEIPEFDTTPMVRDRAYELWERAGRPYGREYEFWFQASREIEGDIEARKQEANEHRIVAR